MPLTMGDGRHIDQGRLSPTLTFCGSCFVDLQVALGDMSKSKSRFLLQARESATMEPFVARGKEYKRWGDDHSEIRKEEPVTNFYCGTR